MAKFSEIFGVDKGVGPGTVSLEALLDEVKFGLMPVGTVFPVMTNIAGALSAPASGIVADGLMLCDGAAIPALLTLSGSTPNLSGDVFLQGSSSAGAAGGSNMTTDHTHTDNLAAPAHTHSFSGSYPNHTHTNDFSINNDTHSHGPGAGTGFTVVNDGGTQFLQNSGQVSLNTTTATNNDTHNHGIAGGITSSGGGSISGTVGAASDTTLIGAVGTGASAASTDNRPSYVSVQYLIRVI